MRETVGGAVTARLRLPLLFMPVSGPSMKTPEGDMPCFSSVTPVKVV